MTESVDRFLCALRQEKDAFADRIQKSLGVIEQALDKFGIESIILSFNGGKDACVVFYLLHYVMWKRGVLQQFGTQTLSLCGTLGTVGSSGTHAPSSSGTSAAAPSLRIVYFSRPSSSEFPEITEIMRSISLQFDVSYSTVEGCSFRDGMQALVDDYGVRAVLMGQRRGDPYVSGTTPAFEPSSPDWPDFTRVYPALDWTYAEVWRFLRDCSLPYCSLYDRGYSSIGDLYNTTPNAALELRDCDGAVSGYLPAFRLEDQSLERANRK